MTEGPKAHLPAKEVLRFGGALFLRIAVSVMGGLACMKAIQWWGAVSNQEALSGGYALTGVILGFSLLLRPIPWPEVDFGPDPKRSLLDDDQTTA